MRTLAAAFVTLLAVTPASAQANANLAPGGIVDGDKATLNAAGGTAPDGKPLSDTPGTGAKAATSGETMVKRDLPGGRATPAK